MHICYWYHRPYGSTRSTAIDEYVRFVSSKSEHDVTVIAAGEEQKPNITWNEGIRVINIPSDVSTARSVAPSLFGLRGLRHIRKLHKKHPIDILQFHAFPGLGIVLSPNIALPSDITTIGDIRGTAVSSERAELLSRLGLRGQRLLVDAMITVDDLVAEHIFGRCPDNVHVVPLGADLHRFDTDKDYIESEGKNANEILVGYVGGLHPSRELHKLIKGVSQVDVGPPIRLYFVGDGRARDSLERQAEEYDQPATFVGSVPHSEVPEHLASMDIAVSYIPNKPQYTNQPPIKTIEYLASGVPTVATLTRWHSQNLDDGQDAVLVHDSVNGVRDGISRLLSSPEFRSKLASQGRESVTKFNYSVIVKDQLLPLYDELC